MAQGTTADEFLQSEGKNRAGQGIVEGFFARLPPTVLNGLTPDQKRAIGATLVAGGAYRPPVSIRFSLPLLFRRIFFTVVAGSEKRSTRRLADDRRHNPLWSLGNSIFLVSTGAMFFLALLLVILFSSSVLEY